MSETDNPDIAIIGAGPGGYVAAIRAAQLGKKVVLIDKGTIGGECLNWGCIPSKALISAANLYHKIGKDTAEMGIIVQQPTINMEKLQQWKTEIQTRLIDGIKHLLKANRVKTIIGTARFLNKHQIQVEKPNGEKKAIEPQHIIIATGTRFMSLPGFEIDEEKILSAKGALTLKEVPKQLLVIGGGVIGLELGTVYAKLGSKVTIVELMPELLPGVDSSLVRPVKRKLKELGVAIYTKARALGYTENEGLLSVKIDTDKQGEIVIEADKLLLSVGKVASTEELGTTTAGIKIDERGFIVADNQQRTNVPHIFAIGDCTGMPFLAHRAMKQGIIAAEVIAGKKAKYDYRAVPSAIFTDPEIATVGIGEKKAKQEGHEIVVSRAMWGASGKAMSQMETLGFVKIIADKDSGVLLGAEIVGPHASDLISEIALALEIGATTEDIGFTMHPHPTLPEMIMEAAEATLGKAIHIPNPRNIVSEQ